MPLPKMNHGRVQCNRQLLRQIGLSQNLLGQRLKAGFVANKNLAIYNKLRMACRACLIKLVTLYPGIEFLDLFIVEINHKFYLATTVPPDLKVFKYKGRFTIPFDCSFAFHHIDGHYVDAHIRIVANTKGSLRYLVTPNVIACKVPFV